jgi:hypothetical protein
MTKVQITERALLARVNRKLNHDGERLKSCPASRASYSELGDYYIVDLGRNTITAQHVDLLALALDLGCIKPYEELEVV